MFYDEVRYTDLGKRAHVLKHSHNWIIIGPFEGFFHEISLWRGHISVIYFILTKQCFVHVISQLDIFYKQYIKSEIRAKYLDDDGTSMKPKQYFTKKWIGRMSQYGSNNYSSRGKRWYRNMKNRDKMLEEK